MSMEITIDKMTVSEKVCLLEKVWDSLCHKSGDVQSPEWHKSVLELRKRRIENGQATISPWSEAKKRLMELD